jgi:ABC-type glycerol-3-phosphate transport system substrate-binding protein
MVWFELTAYERDNHQWVTTIAIRHEQEPRDEVLACYSSMLRLACEDFLYDFDPLRILPKNEVASGLPGNGSLMNTVDHSYYAAVRKLAREMESHDAQRLASLYAPPAALTATDRSTDSGPLNQLKSRLHI